MIPDVTRRIFVTAMSNSPSFGCLFALYFQWRLLEMSGVERRRLFCAVLFHCVAALCVMWSLFVLIERAVEEVNRGLIGKIMQSSNL